MKATETSHLQKEHLVPERLTPLQIDQERARAIKSRPGHGTAGRQPTRESLAAHAHHGDPGMFGRMFPDLDPLAVDDGPLMELADAMTDADPASGDGNNT